MQNPIMRPKITDSVVNPGIPLGFGSGVGISGDYAMIGATGDNQAGESAGAVYVYVVPEPATMSLLAMSGIALLQRKRK